MEFGPSLDAPDLEWVRMYGVRDAVYWACDLGRNNQEFLFRS